MAMDLYLSNCYKAAQAAATKAAASSLTVKREKCDTVSGGQSIVLLRLLAPGRGLGGQADRRGGRVGRAGGGRGGSLTTQLPASRPRAASGYSCHWPGLALGGQGPEIGLVTWESWEAFRVVSRASSLNPECMILWFIWRY